jgi:hypothetical protein
MKAFEGRGMRANVGFGTARETILQHGFEQKIAKPRRAGPTPSSQAFRAADGGRRELPVIPINAESIRNRAMRDERAT